MASWWYRTALCLAIPAIVLSSLGFIVLGNQTVGVLGGLAGCSMAAALIWGMTLEAERRDAEQIETADSEQHRGLRAAPRRREASPIETWLSTPQQGPIPSPEDDTPTAPGVAP
jgi:hypothetical protein